MLAIIIAEGIANLIIKYRSWREHSKCVDELNCMTDYELRDIGISRSEIFSVCNHK